MMIKVQLYGITREFVGESELLVQAQKEMSVGALRKWLVTEHPAFAKLPHFMVAVNQSYAFDEDIVRPIDEIAIIPPVSGG